MSLFPIINTHKISPTVTQSSIHNKTALLANTTQVLSSILTTAYNASEEIDSPPSLLLLSESNRDALLQYTYNSVSQLPIQHSFKSPFLGWEIEQIAGFLTENAQGTVVDQTVFLVADGQTAEDENTFLLVHNLDGSLQSIRVSAAHGNMEAVSVSVGTKDLNELRSLADDGVFRGCGRGQPPLKGGRAPRKQL